MIGTPDSIATEVDADHAPYSPMCDGMAAVLEVLVALFLL
jgi:hypothetical protein